MSTESFSYGVFLSHSAKDKVVMHPLAERLPVAERQHLKVWFDGWKIPVAPVCDRRDEGRRSQSAATAAKIDARLEHSRVLELMSPFPSPPAGTQPRNPTVIATQFPPSPAA
jgi:hypothetical protein